MIVTLDFETYYSQTYSLRRLSEVDYILNDLFQPIMCSVKLGDAPTEVYTRASGLSLQAVFAGIDWSQVALLSHNIRFDGAILYWHYGIQPAMYLDTLSMARALTHPLIGSSSLAKVAKYMGLPDKGDAVVRALGKRAEDFSHAEFEEYAEYCKHDTELCRTIFDKFMAVGFPKRELAVIDMAARAFIEPQARLNPMILAEHLNQVRAEKAAVMARMSHLTPDVFSSNIKFAQLLESFGVEVPKKISPTTGKDTYALAKNDRAFKELCADTSQSAEVQAACACRLGVKSTIEETRTETMLNLSMREWDSAGAGWMPVPYRYYGAHTGRFSADGGFNFANLRRGSRIREAIEAPLGYRVVHRDSSQIECRTLATLARCTTLVDAFRAGRDVYSDFATLVYGFVVTKADTLQRFIGKTCVLGLGYGMGPAKLRHTLFIGAGGMSTDMDEAEARRLVYAYRGYYHQIPQNMWVPCEMQLQRMILAKRPDHPNYNQVMSQPEPFIPVVKFQTDAIELPNGLAIQYPDLGTSLNELGAYDFVYGDRMEKSTKKIYGQKVTENITQALARIIMTDVALRVQAETGFRPFMSTYDSHDYIVPMNMAEEFDAYLAKQFAIPPTWLLGVPLASEGGWGRNLLEAEKGANI